jgi:hypothetical protein
MPESSSGLVASARRALVARCGWRIALAKPTVSRVEVLAVLDETVRSNGADPVRSSAYSPIAG